MRMYSPSPLCCKMAALRRGPLVCFLGGLQPVLSPYVKNEQRPGESKPINLIAASSGVFEEWDHIPLAFPSPPPSPQTGEGDYGNVQLPASPRRGKEGR